MEDPERRSVPTAMRGRYDEIVARTDAVCSQHLASEYAELCRRLTAALCRKRPSPLRSGRVDIWACGITYAIGSVNFLFDRSQTPHMTAGELCALFGVSSRTGAAQATKIRKIFDMYQLDPAWCLPSLIDQNPYAWMISVNGIYIDARVAPLAVQEEAVRLGLIPYLPATRQQ
jgi:hypothetical protein